MKWYKNKAELDDIVLSTSVRLSRNFKDYPFPVKLNVQEKKQICDFAADILMKDEDETLKYIELKNLDSYQLCSLVEKQLVTSEFVSDSQGRGLILSDDEDISIMLCEEDHVNIGAIRSGLALEEAFESAKKFDEKLENSAAIAFDEKLGYLTQCPTNLGTGMRAATMIHLPALTANGAITRLAATVSKLGLTLKAVYGNTRESIGEIYQLSNRVTLGISEEAAISNLASITKQIVKQETQAREKLVEDERVIDKIYRAYGLLKSAHILSCKELINLMSPLRLGAAAGILNIPLETLTSLLFETQPATLSSAAEKALSSSERDKIRAEKVREALS